MFLHHTAAVCEATGIHRQKRKFIFKIKIKCSVPKMKAVSDQGTDKEMSQAETNALKKYMTVRENSTPFLCKIFCLIQMSSPSKLKMQKTCPVRKFKCRG